MSDSKIPIFEKLKVGARVRKISPVWRYPEVGAEGTIIEGIDGQGRIQIRWDAPPKIFNECDAQEEKWDKWYFVSSSALGLPVLALLLPNDWEADLELE